MFVAKSQASLRMGNPCVPQTPNLSFHFPAPRATNPPCHSSPASNKTRQRKKALHSLNMVLLLPPAPAALVLVGRAFATLSARSAAAFRRSTVFAPPGGDEGRAVVPALEDCGGGEERGGVEDCFGGNGWLVKGGSGL